MSDGETREEALMDIINPQQAERETLRVQANREELVERIARAMRSEREPLSRLMIRNGYSTSTWQNSKNKKEAYML